MHKTRLLIEVDVTTQFESLQAWQLIQILLKAPAISSITLKSGMTEHPESSPTSVETKFRRDSNILTVLEI